MAAGTFRLADVFSKSFAVYGRRFVPFIVLTIIASIPIYLLIFLVGTPTRIATADPADLAASMGPAVILALANVVTKSLASGAVMYGVVQELRGRAFSVGDSLQIALRRFLPIVGIAICTSIVVMLGTILLIVPGLMLLCMFYVSTPVCVAEQTGVFTSMSRSRFLTKGHRWQVFGMILVIGVGAFALGAIVGVSLAWAGPTIAQIANSAVSAIVDAFGGVLMGVLYYQLRVAKEGIDINKIAGVFD
jgi:hypothetical protein